MRKTTVAVAVVAVLLVWGTYLARGTHGVAVTNTSGEPTTVYVTFGGDSSVRGWSFCADVPGGCRFQLADKATRDLPTSSEHLNATLSFGGPVACGRTKVELNVNNPSWYDVVDISLVDGFDQAVQVVAKDDRGSTTLGPVRSSTGNQAAFGVYPLGCDVCTAREDPPCGIPKGRDGCKAGSQYHPDVPCQYQGVTMGGGSDVTVELL